MIDRAIECIRNGQSPDGGFAHISSTSSIDFSSAIPRRTTFFASNILTCLQNIPGRTLDIQNAAAGFLLSQKSERCSFNYWARGADAETKITYPPYPDDLDDTFAALSALSRYDPSIIDGHVLSAVAKLLSAQEISEGGPYRTWLIGDDAPPAWQDADVVVNSTIGYFLSLVGVRLPALEHFVERAVHENRLTSQYYPGIFHVTYLLSRFYKNNVNDGTAATRGAVIDAIFDHLRRNDGENVTSLELAMEISSLINLGYTEEVTPSMVDTLANRLKREGFLPHAFCIDPARDGRQCYAGASALTAAFCAEAFALYIHRRPASGATRKAPTIHAYLCSIARSACRDLNSPLREIALAEIDGTTDEKITGLAYEFRDALYRSGSPIPPEITEQLSLANLYGWMAYDIYDDALDGDGDSRGIPSLIPCANFFFRALAEIYSVLATRNPEMGRLFRTTMNCMDNANTWEQKYCRIPATPLFGSHDMLADRSIGHAMGPLAELLFAGYGADSEEYKNVELFFRHYLIARQLHDDAHDWAEDLLRGRVTSVGALVLAAHFGKERLGAVNVPTIAAALPELRGIFWKEAIDEVVGIITLHINKARQARRASFILDSADFMERDLRALESGAGRALKERDEVRVFLNDYRASPPSGATF